MTTDRELLELAAKAAGIEIHPDNIDTPVDSIICINGSWWDPRDDDADALRLAVKLGLLVDCLSHCARPLPDSLEWQEASGSNPFANTRRAIVLAAAEIGKAMP